MESTPNTKKELKSKLYYDKECRFCVGCANFVGRHDKHKKIELVPIQDSQHAQRDGCYESIIYIEGGKQSQYSTAVVAVLKTMGGFWYGLGILLWIVPRPVRDWGYRFVGKRRHWFGGSKPVC